MPLHRLAALFVLPAFALCTIAASAAPAMNNAAMISAATAGVLADVPHIANISDMGRAPASAAMSVAVMLGYRHQNELEALVEAQGDPASPYYRHYLNAQQFNTYFAPTASDYQRAVSTLASSGFTVSKVYANRTLIDATVSVAAAERFFTTEIHRVSQPRFGVRYANARTAVVPASLHGLVTGVAGLNTIRTLHTFNHFADKKTLVRPQLGVPGRIFGPDLGYGPTAFINAYDLPSRTATGKGQVAAVVIDADFLNSDVAGYLKFFGISRSGPPIRRIPIDGGPPQNTADSVEATLDVETISSLAPGAGLLVYEFPSFDNPQFILDAYEQAVIDGVAGTVNSSFGGCETSLGLSFAQMTDQIALQGAALGMTFHASTGDSGSLAFGCSSTSVITPASDPHFVAVGGTSLFVDPTTANVQREFGWGDLDGATGGGISVFFPVPSYQKNVANVNVAGRNIPDVSFNADPATGESLFLAGSFQGPIGGTSLSSPIFGGALTLINQVAGRPAGFVNPRLYSTFRKSGYGTTTVPLFRDMTVGNNGFFNAAAGYDQMTGIGAMEFANLTNDIH